MTARRRFASPIALCLFPLVALAALHGCSGDDSGGGGGGGAAGSEGGVCPTESDVFEAGDDTGSADPYGAKAAGQARAGRLTDAAMIVQPAHGRQRVNVGDFVLANDKIAVTIEDKGLSDGYARFGGEILAVDRVGDDGKPMGTSYYVETLMALSIQMVNPTSVSVMNDGSDGKAAVVRVSGPLEAIPFLDGSLATLFPRRYDVQAAYDYVLEPGSNKLLVRLGIMNPAPDPIEFAFDGISDEIHGFFQTNHNKFVTEANGFGKATGDLPWAGFVNEGTSFAWRAAGDETLQLGLEVSGFVYTLGPGFNADACAVTWVDHAEVVAGGPEYDGLRVALNEADGAEAWREISGTVKDADGNPVADAYVHERDDTGKYLSRTKADGSGNYKIHAPAGQAVKLIPQAKGYPLGSGTDVGGSATSSDLAFDATGKLHVTAVDSVSNEPIPVRVQVIPKAGYTSAPEEFGVQDEAHNRLHQAYATTGDVTLSVPPGDHEVIVTRGYEYELSDQTITVTAGQTSEVPVTLERSVDSTGWMCADWHIHSFQSADSDDTPDSKVASAICDGLEIPVSSEHEWVIDFQPIVEKLGLTKWAFGMPSEELTTFTWGHFGVVPLLPKPDKVNNGAIEWVGKEPPAMFADVQGQPEDPVLIVNHPSGTGFGAYFSQASFDDATGAGKDKALWSDNFDAIEVFNDSDFESNRKKSVAAWFSMLNHDKTVWAVGSSDSHHIRTSPVGYARTCLYFGHDDPTQLTVNGVRDVLASGKAVVSGGLFMTVDGPGGSKPGETVTGASGTADFTVTVQSPSWLNPTTLEVIVNGETVSTEALAPLGTGTGKTFVNQVTVTLDATKARNWVVFHASGDNDLAPLHPGRLPFAVSNPVFFTQ